SVSITYGKQKNTQTQHTDGNKVEKSQINAGGKVNIITTGTEKNDDLTIMGSDVSGNQGTHLSSQNNVNILAMDENHHERSKNKSSGWNAGVAVSYGQSGFSFGVTAGGNVAKGYGNGDSKAWVNSYVGSQNSQTTIDSKKDTNIKSSQVVGKQITVNAENLNIESLQDTATYKGKQESASGQVTVGYGVSASASYSQSKINSNYASVNQQAGIFAGDDGYNITANGTVSNIGGAIISSAPKEKNRLTALDFTFADIQNYSNAQASSMGFAGGFSINRDQTSKEDEKLNEVYRKDREKNGETFNGANPNKQSSSPVKFGLGENDVHSDDMYALAKIGLVNALSNTSEKENHSSVTKAIVSDGVFTIASEQGKSQIETVTKGTSENAQSLQQVDYQSLQNEVELSSAIKRTFLTNVAGLTDESYHKMMLSEHRMMKYETDENGNPITDKQILEAIYEEADKLGIDREKYLKTERNKGRNTYKLYELSDEERKHIQPVTYTDPNTGKETTKYFVAFNGIFNDVQAAAKFAVQNYIAETNPETGKIDQRIYKDLYFVHHPEADNFLSELMIAGYQKFFVSGDNSVKQAENLMQTYGDKGLYLGSHSRGTLTISNALQRLDTEENRTKGILSDTTLKMVGPATDVTRANTFLSGLQGSSTQSILFENDGNDPVGTLIGGNPATSKTNVYNKNWWNILTDVVGDNSSSHNCHGLGQPQCIEDGYRKDKELYMHKEKTISDFNSKVNK
ncbi:hemagglutinin repeat-containing protein, partial [Lonepinella sp. BR2357]|uniref:hemagglutinin repeat-containing protein n=1 Tax=Lonepinella sp. BR2357 TaxID=3434549 RepID=UPI003F6E3C02